MERRRGVILALGFLVLLGLAALLWSVVHKPAKKAAAPPPVPVTAEKAVAQDLPLTIEALGAAQAWTSDTILPQVGGKLLRVNFREGGEVKAGQVLAEIDPAPYQAALIEAQGTLQRDRAVLAGAEVDLARYQRLLAKDSIARQTEEDQQATVDQDKGTVRIDEGAVKTAQINLGWTRVVSPISGRAGVRLIDPGNLVSASGGSSSTSSTASVTSASSTSTSGSSSGSSATNGAGGYSGGGSSAMGIVIINQITPMAVTFTVPEADFDRLMTLSGGFARSLPVKAYSQETSEQLDSGEVQIADNRVDPTSGTVELKARFANAGKRLWPGRFVDIRLVSQTLSQAVVIPLSAVNRGPKGQFVFVVGQNGQAVMRPVSLATTQGTTAVVKSGVKAGETVVTDGQMVIKAGSKVRVVQNPADAASAGGSVG